MNFSTAPGIIPISWPQINSELHKIGCEEYNVPGSSFCLVDSLVHVLQVEYKMDVSIQNAKHLIQNQAIEEHGKYINFHCVKKPEQYIPKYITNADLFLEEIISFFNNCAYTQDVIDVLIKIAADALGINILVYQENQGITQLLELRGCQFGKTVFVKFRRNDLHPQGNHYNPVILSHQEHLYDAKCKYNNENLQHMGSQQKESSSLKNDEPEVRDEISTPTFEYEIAYYTKDHSPIYQFKVKEESKKQNEETEQKKRIKQNEETEQKKRIKQNEETEQKKRIKQNEETEQKKRIKQNQPLDLSMKSPSTLNATQKSTQDTYSPVSYTMDYVTQGSCVQLTERNDKQKQHKESHNQMPRIGRGK